MMFVSARSRGKQVSASNLSFYAGRAVEAGRKVAGTSGLDALSDTPLARRRIPPHVDLGDTADSLTVFCRTFGDKRWRWPVVDYVAPHMDFEAFRSRCRLRDRRILTLKARGCPQTEIAARLGISPPAVNQRLRTLEARWKTMAAA